MLLFFKIYNSPGDAVPMEAWKWYIVHFHRFYWLSNDTLSNKPLSGPLTVTNNNDKKKIMMYTCDIADIWASEHIQIKASSLLHITEPPSHTHFFTSLSTIRVFVFPLVTSVHCASLRFTFYLWLITLATLRCFYICSLLHLIQNDCYSIGQN